VRNLEVGLREIQAVDRPVGNRQEEIRGVARHEIREEDLQEGTLEESLEGDHLESQEEVHRVGNHREEIQGEHQDRQEIQVEDHQTESPEEALVAA